MVVKILTSEEITKMLFVQNGRLTTREAETFATNEQLRNAYAEYARFLSQRAETPTSAIADAKIDSNSWEQIRKLGSDSSTAVGLMSKIRELAKRIEKLFVENQGTYSGHISADHLRDSRYKKDFEQLWEIRTGGIVTDPILADICEYLPAPARQPLPRRQEIKPAA